MDDRQHHYRSLSRGPLAAVAVPGSLQIERSTIVVEDDSYEHSADSPDATTKMNPSSKMPKFKRSSIACRRCRRLRTKCVQDEFKTPCIPCRRAGPAEANACAFAARGDDEDRKFRFKRPGQTTQVNQGTPVTPGTPIYYKDSYTSPSSPSSSTKANDSIPPPLSRRGFYSPSDVWNHLPPHEELLQGCRVFVTTCLQVGFLPKALFLEQLANSHESINVFLLLGMLSISARFTPELCQRFGNSNKVSEFFLEIAQVMIADEMYKTTLENAQAFFLLGMAEWGKGDRGRSSINMGIAVRMAGVLRLHREESYVLQANASADDIVNSERARRTFWIIQNHDNLYAQQHLPVSFAKSDITTLLPCSENDFAFGRIPAVRAALAGTAAAKKDPLLVSIQSRSLFATLIQAHDLWGQIARRAYTDQCSRSDAELPPWDGNSQYKRTADMLRNWERDVPIEHKWSKWNLRGFKAEHLDLAYLSIVTITKLNNIVLRRAYLGNIVSYRLEKSTAQDEAPAGFWDALSYELFSNVWELYESIDTFFSLRSQDDGFPAMLAFCTYTCASLASYLYKWPQLCPQLSSNAVKILHRSLEVLTTFEDKWPAVSEWTSVLRKVAEKQPSKKSKPSSEVSSQEALLNTATSIVQSPDLSRNPQRLLSHQDMNLSNRLAPILATRSSPAPFSQNPYQPHPPHPQQPHSDSEGYNQHTPSSTHDNNLHMLSAAASYGSYAYPQTAEQPPPPGLAEQPHIANYGVLSDNVRGPSNVSGPPAPHELSSPDSADVALLANTFENDLADFVQGYAPLGWAGWQM